MAQQFEQGPAPSQAEIYTKTETDGLLDTKAAIIHDTVSGAIASFPDGANNLPVSDLTVAIEPAQDLHGYDSPWPAGGGKNLWPPFSDQTKSGVTLTAENGTVTLNGTATEDAYFDIDVSIPAANGTALYLYAFNPVASVTRTSLFVITTAGNPQANMNVANASATDAGTADRTITKLRLRAPSGETFTNFKLSPYLQIGGSAPTAFTPYSNICPITGRTGATISHSGADTTDPDEISITFPSEAGTVYGGSLNVTTGVLTVDRATRTFDGSERWDLWGGVFVNFDLTDIVQSNTDSTSNILIVADRFKPNGVTYRDACGDGNIIKVIGFNTQIACYSSAYADVNAFKSALSNSPMAVCYSIATPITYTLTPQEIRTFLGTNNIWADTGDTSVGYKADTKLYIAKLISELGS